MTQRDDYFKLRKGAGAGNKLHLSSSMHQQRLKKSFFYSPTPLNNLKCPLLTPHLIPSRSDIALADCNEPYSTFGGKKCQIYTVLWETGMEKYTTILKSVVTVKF